MKSFSFSGKTFLHLKFIGSEHFPLTNFRKCCDRIGRKVAPFSAGTTNIFLGGRKKGIVGSPDLLPFIRFLSRTEEIFGNRLPQFAVSFSSHAKGTFLEMHTVGPHFTSFCTLLEALECQKRMRPSPPSLKVQENNVLCSLGIGNHGEWWESGLGT